ncbi:MAG: RsmE family RNA methyltransferase [Candidatus Paceibacterota bacterium]|jgi:16S rRNA (uracil1498-N3)-methyltransferase
MKIHNFFVEEKLAGKNEAVVADAVLVHQWLKVLRFHIGERVNLFDNSGQEYLAEIVSLDRKVANLKLISSKLNVNCPKTNVTLLFSLIKKDKLEWLIEKCTEIGVSHFQPIISERSEVKGFNLERAQKIIKEACEQSGRAILPTVSEPISLTNALKSVPQPAFAFDSSGSSFSSTTNYSLPTTNFFIGPEGGFTPNEIEMFKTAGVKIYSLGSQTLRAETAAVAVSTLLLLGK